MGEKELEKESDEIKVEEKLLPASKVNKKDLEKQIKIGVKLLEKHDYAVIPKGFLKCSDCGRTLSLKEGNFYNSQSRMNKSHGKIPVCKTCIEKYYNKYMVDNAGSVKKSLYLLAQELNCVFKQTLVDMALAEKELRGTSEYKTFIGKANSLSQFKGMSFKDSDPFDLTADQVAEEEKRAEDAINFTEKDLSNRDQLVEIIGKDPFERMSILDRKSLYFEFLENLDEDIAENPFLCSQLEIVVVNNNTIRKMNDALSRITEDIAQLDVNEGKIKGLISNIKNLSGATTTIAKENGIAKKNSDNKKRSTLTGMMSYYRDLNIDEIEVDFYDQVGSIGMQRVADISMKAIFAQGLFNDDDFEQILKHNVEATQSMEKRAMLAEENVRQLKKENFRLSNGGDVDIALLSEQIEEEELDDLEIVEEE